MKDLLTPSVLLAVIALLGTVLTAVDNRRQKEATTNKTTAEQENIVVDSATGTVALVSSGLAYAKAELEQARLELERARGLIASMREELENVKLRQAEHERSLSVIEQDRTTLAEALSLYVEWEDKGRPDPPGPPSIGAQVRFLLSQVHSA